MKTDASRNEISVCLASERARERVARAIRVVGADISNTSVARLQTENLPTLQRLVYDLHPWSPYAAAMFLKILQTNPALRVLLYIPIRADSLEMLPRFGGMDRVCSKVQHFSVATFGLLCGLVRFVNTGDTCSVCESVVAKAIPDLTQNMQSVLRVATANVTGSKTRTANRVGGLARDLRVSSRTLTRRFMDGGLPPPKEFLDWMLLMHVADRAAREGLPVASVARRLGYDANALYRVKKRRLGQAAAGDRFGYDLVRDLFIERCRPSGAQQALSAAESVSTLPILTAVR